MLEKDPIYDRGYHSQRHAHLIGDDEYFWARAEASARLYFSPEERSKRIFEYGCGIGQGIAALPHASGWDVSSEAREICLRRGLRVYDDIDTVPRKAWDIVLCRHVLEHLESPLEHLKLMRELIAEHGELLIVLPREKHESTLLTPDLNQHLYCWNFRAINNLLERAGFQPHKNRYAYVLGYRVLLPLRRILGADAYFYSTLIVGHLKLNGELIVRARVKSATPATDL
jgi:SAM-dependent methyltransferase